MYNNINNSMKMYIKYLRKSRKDVEAEEHGEGDTLAKHDLILTNLYRSMRIKDEQVITLKEIVSGDSIASRPVIQEVLQLVEQGGITGVLVVEVERLARGNTLDQGIVSNAFQYSNTKIITPLKIYDPSNEFDQEYFEFGLFMSRREYKTINRRLQNGRTTSATQGKFPASRAPYGYKRKKLEHDKGWTLEIVPEQAETIKCIFNLYAYQNMKPSEICKYLDKLNVKPLKSNAWSSNSIRDILSNPVYAGKIRWKDRKVVKVLKDGKIINTQPVNKGNDVVLVDALHQPIIDIQTFELVQKKKKENNTAPIPGIYNIQNPLCGLIRCSKCGRLMFRVSSETLACTNPKCNNVSSKINIVEKKLIESLKIWLEEHEREIDNASLNNLSNSEIIKIKKNQLEKANIELMKCEDTLERIYGFLEQGIYNIDIFTQRKNKILVKEQEQSKKIEILNEEIKKIEQNEKSKIELIPKVKNVLDIYSKCSNIKEKNELLKTVIKKVDYLKTEKCYGKKSNPENFELMIYTKF